MWSGTVVVDEDSGEEGGGLHSELEALVEVATLQCAAQRVSCGARLEALVVTIVATIARPGVHFGD